MKNHPAIKLTVVACLVCGSLIGGDVSSSVRKSDWCPMSIGQLADPGRRISDRINAARLLGPTLNPEEIRACYEFLLQPASEKDENLPGLRALKNDVLCSLQEQEAAPVELVDVLVRMYGNKAEDKVIRDYAIQHLATWCQKSSSGSLADKSKAVGTLISALQERTSIAGTALLGLHRISTREPSVKTMLDCAALSFAISSDTDLRTRITAMQVCAERGLTKALPTICDLAVWSPRIAIRVSAIGALGKMGGPEYSGFLRQLQFDRDPIIRAAASSALRKNHHFITKREVVETAQ